MTTVREIIGYMESLRDFLRQHAHETPRTMLRYAIVRMDEPERLQWMRQGKHVTR